MSRSAESDMVVLDRPAAMRQWSEDQRRAGVRIGFVATMGALHDGHLSLIDVARRCTDLVIVSIFVNPLQFDRRDDFDGYPRPIDADVESCRVRGVDAVYAPTAAVMYPEGFDTTVVPGALAAPMEGAMRPGHFTGVATVVTKLFGAVRPHVAVFGEKDFQQLAIIRRMVDDLDLGIEIVAAPIIRELDGLATSSRNRRLSPAHRAAAVAVPQALDAAVAAYRAGEHAPAALEQAVRDVIDAEAMAKLDYVSVFQPDTLLAVDDGEEAADHTRIAIAVWFGDVRLIDNRKLGVEPTPASGDQ